MASLVICVATLLAGIVMAGLSSAAFYGLLSKFTTESPLPQTAFVLAQLGKPHSYSRITVNGNISIGDSFCISSEITDDEFASLKVLEGTLFGCGLASIFVNALSILFLRLNNQIISHEAMISSSILSASNANRYWWCYTVRAKHLLYTHWHFILYEFLNVYDFEKWKIYIYWFAYVS